MTQRTCCLSLSLLFVTSLAFAQTEGVMREGKLVLQAPTIVGVEVHDNVYVEVVLSTMVADVEPSYGELIVGDEGLVYIPDADILNLPDEFIFKMDQPSDEGEVYFKGVSDGSNVRLVYAYVARANTPSPVVSDEDQCTIIGTVVQSGTSLDFPGGTIVIGSVESSDGDLAAIDHVEGDELHLHDNVDGVDGATGVLGGYPEDSTCNVVLSGHGVPGGGVNFGSDNLVPTNVGVHALCNEVNNVLKDGGVVTLLGCCLGQPEHRPGIHEMADDWGVTFKVNTGLVTFFGTALRDAVTNAVVETFYTDWEGQGLWLCIEPFSSPDDPNVFVAESNEIIVGGTVSGGG